ncbi:MAG: hypothetical protein GXN93_04635 [Candidatus Diapherotrites archaeon]|nr:hypothetical protein [Candidatus Diapherotrites archaeon]
MNQILAIALAYILGSISFPGLYARLKGLNLYDQGEGHLGATSIYSATKSLPLFLALGILDAAKGLVAYHLFGTWGLVAAMLGHMFPIFFKFRGGNAVSVYYGGIFSISPVLVLICAGSELAISRITRSRWRHVAYLVIRAIPAAIYPILAPAYAILFLRHAWFYYVRFRQGSS